MATADSVKAKMQGLIDSANAKTGAGDATLTAAVNTLIAGFGSGGGGGGASGIYMAKVTPSSDKGNLQIVHNLGTTDILCAMAWAETMGDVVPTFGGSLGSFWFKNDIPNSRTDSTLTMYAAYHTTNANITAAGIPNSAAYWNQVIDENTFKFERAGSSAAKFIAGITYTVIIIPASAFSGV